MSNSTTQFCYPVKRLENSRVLLVPFDPPSHSAPFVNGTKDHPELFAYLPYGPFQNTEDFDEQFYRSRIQHSSTETLFAILVKNSATLDRREEEEQSRFAGTIGLLNASLAHASLEMGFITLLPEFHGTFVARNAIGLLLLYVLDPPSEGGLGLRRCQWQAHANNEPSRRVAMKLHFTFEGVQRFQRVLPEDKIGNGVDMARLPDGVGKRELGPSRDSAVFAHYCDEWSDKRRLVLEVMERR